MKQIQPLLFVLIFLLNINTVFAAPSVYNVGFWQLSTDFSNKKMPIAVWYPTKAKAHAQKFGAIIMEVAKNSQIASGQFGLILISHGTGGSYLGHRQTAQYLAAHGYIVAAVMHPEDNFKDNSAARTTRNWINRPRHLSKAIDVILSAKGFNQAIDKKKIGVIGHSAGGYSALVMAGGIPETDLIFSHCKNHSDPEFCGHSSLLYRLSGFFALDVKADQLNGRYRLADPRIKAAVLMAPVGVLFNHADSLKGVKIPIKIYRSEKDKILRYPYHAELIRKMLPSKPEFTVVQNAGHFSYLSSAPKSIRDKFSEISKDPPNFNRQAFITQLDKEILEFFNNTLG